jgi:hypothetical protein
LEALRANAGRGAALRGYTEKQGGFRAADVYKILLFHSRTGAQLDSITAMTTLGLPNFFSNAEEGELKSFEYHDLEI